MLIFLDFVKHERNINLCNLCNSSLYLYEMKGERESLQEIMREIKG